jgi:hypothetical protein
MAKPSLMNLHILILILLNGHKISHPQQQLDTEALSQSETFCEEYSKFSKLAFESVVSSKTSIEQSEYGGSLSWVLPYPGDCHILFFNLIFY